MSYAPEFLELVDKFIHLANDLAEGGRGGEVSAAILTRLLDGVSTLGAVFAKARAYLRQRFP